MPWDVRKVGAEWCVFKKDTDEKVACHPTEEKARKQMAALYANEPGAKALLPVKAQFMEDDEEAAWFGGRVPRRLLAIPFGGPIPSAKSVRGVDLDGEFFDEHTDIYGPYIGLRKSRERLTDFMHSYQPPGPQYGDKARNPATGEQGLMMGHTIGKSILDPDPDEDGWWVDFWFEQGNRRVAMVQALARRGAQLFGSSQPIGKARVDPDGHIAVWPYWLQTISTAPQNTYSVIRPKAVLDEVESLLSDGPNHWSQIEDALRSLVPSLQVPPEMAELEAKAGRVLSATNEQDLLAALEALRHGLDAVEAVVRRQPDYSPKETT